MTAVLQQVSDALATTVATVSPSIVRVEARRRLPGEWCRVVTRWDHCHDPSRYRAGR